MTNPNSGRRPFFGMAVFLLSLFGTFLAFSASAAGLPKGWKSMEIEAKWNNSAAEFQSAVSRFDQLAGSGTPYLGYEIETRWGGEARKYVDVYYDNASGALAKNGHVLRHRTRYSMKNGDWRKDWEKIQFKAQAVRIGAVWFRNETGDCNIWNRKNESLCTGVSSSASNEIQSGSSTHDALVELRRLHPGFYNSPVKAVSKINDLRSRFRFKQDGVDVFELSIDDVETVISGRSTKSYELELESILQPQTEATILDLIEVSYVMQRENRYRPSETSKGGTSVPESAAYESVLDLYPTQDARNCTWQARNGCYWMENRTGKYCWVDSPLGGSDITGCKRLDSCSGGDGASGGGCYKWSRCTNCSRKAWP